MRGILDGFIGAPARTNLVLRMISVPRARQPREEEM
jgi:hypothetical protein